MKKSMCMVAVGLALSVAVSAGRAGDIHTINYPTLLSVTSGGGPSEYHATVTPDQCDALNIPSGTYMGLRVSFDWQCTWGSAQPYDTGFSFYDPTQPVVPTNRIGSYVKSSQTFHVPSNELVRITYDEPSFWLRSFYTVPTPYPGDQSVGMRFNLWTVRSTVEWSNIEVELYEATVSQIAGDSFSGGTWYRPLVDTFNGTDDGRATEETGYSVYPFTVDESGVYGVHTHFYGTSPFDYAMSYLFADEFDVAGDYDHLLYADEQGDYGAGYPDIKSVYLETGHTYFLVQANCSISDGFTFNSWVSGPGNATVVPEPTSFLTLVGLALLGIRRR